jgi:hypothetical protein
MPIIGSEISNKTKGNKIKESNNDNFILLFIPKLLLISGVKTTAKKIILHSKCSIPE